MCREQQGQGQDCQLFLFKNIITSNFVVNCSCEFSLTNFNTEPMFNKNQKNLSILQIFFSIFLITISVCINLISAVVDDAEFWTGGVAPGNLKWDQNPGPCYPPEVPECRGFPFYNCLQWWIPCGPHARDPSIHCCWSFGHMNTTACRQPLHQYGETLGKKEYFYCLPWLDRWVTDLNHHIDYIYPKTPGDHKRLRDNNDNNGDSNDEQQLVNGEKKKKCDKKKNGSPIVQADSRTDADRLRIEKLNREFDKIIKKIQKERLAGKVGNEMKGDNHGNRMRVQEGGNENNGQNNDEKEPQEIKDLREFVKNNNNS